MVALTGPRQTGKSTLLMHLFPDYKYFTFDDPLTRSTALNDPETFLEQSGKIILDEIQYLPEIMPYIKMAVDRDRSQNGRFIITGSQFFPLMEGISETLAGRIALHELLGFSVEEYAGGDVTDPKICYNSIYNGFYPEVLVHHADRNRFFSSYIHTYLERDIRQITSVHDIRVFQNFLELLAARAGALLNLNEISGECGISFMTARRWLSLLESTSMVYLLRPYAKNIKKRVVKTPKIYFTDTGLLSFLLRYPDSESLSAGPHAGAMFENMIVIELLKYRFNHNKNFELYFYRDSNHNEIDLVVDQGVYINFVELKSSSTPREQHLKTIRKLTGEIQGSQGMLACFSKEILKISDCIRIVPWNSIFMIIR